MNKQLMTYLIKQAVGIGGTPPIRRSPLSRGSTGGRKISMSPEYAQATRDASRAFDQRAARPRAVAKPRFRLRMPGGKLGWGLLGAGGALAGGYGIYKLLSGAANSTKNIMDQRKKQLEEAGL